jgi:predicted membrane protein
MVGSAIIIVFTFFTFLFKFNFITIATSHIWGDNCNSQICVGKNYKPYTYIGIPTNTRVCLEVNTHTGTLDYFINDRHIKDRVVNVPKDVYLGV